MSLETENKVPFRGTKEQEEELLRAIEEQKGKGGCLMPIMQKAQEIYGYLPMEVQETIADKLGLSLAEVYGVATFYSQFTLVPKGKVQIGVCLGTACYVKGSGDVYSELQKLLGVESGITEDLIYSLDATRCIGCCGLAPVMTINGDVYGKITKDQVAGLLAKYKE